LGKGGACEGCGSGGGGGGGGGGTDGALVGLLSCGCGWR